MRGARMLKRVSRRRSLVGRVAVPRGETSWRERWVPAMTRMSPMVAGGAAEPKGWEVVPPTHRGEAAMDGAPPGLISVAIELRRRMAGRCCKSGAHTIGEWAGGHFL